MGKSTTIAALGLLLQKQHNHWKKQRPRKRKKTKDYRDIDEPWEPQKI